MYMLAELAPNENGRQLPSKRLNSWRLSLERVFFKFTKWRFALLVLALTYYRSTVSRMWHGTVRPGLVKIGLWQVFTEVWKTLRYGLGVASRGLLQTRVAQSAVRALLCRVDQLMIRLQYLVENQVQSATQKVLDHLRSSMKVKIRWNRHALCIYLLSLALCAKLIFCHWRFSIIAYAYRLP